MRVHFLTTLFTPAALLLGLAWLATPAFAGNQKTTLCHVPPEDPLNAHEIVVSEKAILAHLQNHPGDQVGTCQQGCDSAGDCIDSDLCTQDVCNPDGTCDHSQQVECDDGNVCTIDVCDPATGCMNAPVPDGDLVACDDLDACSGPDVCVAGACAGSAIPGCCANDADCPASDACTVRYCDDDTSACQEVDLSSQCTAGACEVAYCDPSDGCHTAPVTCADDGNICTVAQCNPNICGAAGGCETVLIPPLPNPELICDDGLDNDCDGSVDCVDDDCVFDVACGGPGCTDEPSFSEFAQSPIFTSFCIPKQTLSVGPSGDATICPTQICDGQPGCSVTLSFVSGSGDETTGTLLQSYTMNGSGFSADIDGSDDFTCVATTFTADADIDADLDLIVDGPYLVVNGITTSSTNVTNINLATSGSVLCSVVDLVLEPFLDVAIEDLSDIALDDQLVGNRFCAIP